MTFSDRVATLINDIIHLWISAYKEDYEADDNDFMDETKDMFNLMLKEAKIIEKTFLYINSNINLECEKEVYILTAIEEILSFYSNLVYNDLINTQNRKKKDVEKVVPIWDSNSNVLWKWRFPSKREIKKRINASQKNQSFDWTKEGNVTDIFSFSDEDISVENQDFLDEVAKIIDDIIDLWISDYKRKFNISDDLTKETTIIWDEMFNSAEIIKYCFLYIITDLDLEDEFLEDHMLDAVKEILWEYRKIVYESLVKLHWKTEE